jgi:hypothetical protein
MKPLLPDNLLPKVAQLCQSAAGPAHVKLVLKNGSTIYDVVVSKDGEIVRAGGRPVFGEQELRFRPSDIVDMYTY